MARPVKTIGHVNQHVIRRNTTTGAREAPAQWCRGGHDGSG